MFLLLEVCDAKVQVQVVGHRGPQPGVLPVVQGQLRVRPTRERKNHTQPTKGLWTGRFAPMPLTKVLVMKEILRRDGGAMISRAVLPEVQTCLWDLQCGGCDDLQSDAESEPMHELFDNSSENSYPPTPTASTAVSTATMRRC